MRAGKIKIREPARKQLKNVISGSKLAETRRKDAKIREIKVGGMSRWDPLGKLMKESSEFVRGTVLMWNVIAVAAKAKFFYRYYVVTASIYRVVLGLKRSARLSSLKWNRS